MKRQPLLAAGFATLAAVLWTAALGAGSRLPADLPIAEIVAIRYVMQLMLLAVIVLPFRGARIVATAQPRLQIARGLTMVLMPITFELALRRLNPSEALALLWLAPMIGIALDRSINQDASPRVTLAIAGIATASALLAHHPAITPSIRGTILIMCAAGAFGAFFSLTRALRAEPATTGLFWTAACVAACFLPFLPFVWQRPSAHTLTVLAALSTLWLLTLFSIDEALRRAPLVLLAPFLLTEVIWTRGLFRAPWSGMAAIGSLAVVLSAAVALVALLKARTELPSSSAAGIA